ncbi:hypothetical protein GCM10022197_22040 [Microlunatus spumicola]|uniref:Uncharacterized protein n=1 Tax=Microlunatus spumicola TaxID=81499 RepID=A0ABP6XE44_9ACTN
MSVVNLTTAADGPITVIADRITIHDLVVTHGEAAAIARRQQDAEALTELLRRAIPVGIIALTMGTVDVGSRALTQTLDDWSAQVEQKSAKTIAELERTLAHLRSGEQTVLETANAVLAGLPAQLEAAMRGEAANVRQSVGEAAHTVQAAGLHEIRTALAGHQESVRNALSLDREGPVQALRRDLLAELNGTRAEISEQLTVVRAMLQAAEAGKAAGAKSSREVGRVHETDVMTQMRDIVTGAADLFEETGGQPGADTTRRTGDGVATIPGSITGKGAAIKILIEAKARSRKLSLPACRTELEAGRRVRGAVAGLMLVRSADEVPGGGPFCQVDEMGWVVAADDWQVVRLIYLFVREKAILTRARSTESTADLVALERQLNLAMAALGDLSEVGKLAGQAETNLQKLREVGRRVSARLQEALQGGLDVLHQ